jgi:alpha-L-fucosidase
MGAFLQKNGEAIYGTRGGPIPPRNWGVTTRKGDRVYVHVLEWADPVLALSRAALGRAVRKASFLADGAPVPVATTAEAVSLTLGNRRDPLDTVVVLELGAK